jgi:predicted DCC family thiol-disulfide oxidoreductase YuxK
MKPLAVLGKWMVPQFLRDLIYDGVADNRYSIMGMRDECRFDSDGEFNDRFVDDDLAMDNR